MGKSSSKLSAESIMERLKQQQQQVPKQQQQHPNANTRGCNYPLNENELRKWCKNFNKDFPDAQLTNILDNEQLLAPFLTDILYQEVEVSDCMQTLFRGNCLASKIMSHCFRTFGSDYLKQLLKPHIEPLIMEAILVENSSIELDDKLANSSPSRASNNSVDSVTANIENNSTHQNHLHCHQGNTHCHHNNNNNDYNFENNHNDTKQRGNNDTNSNNNSPDHNIKHHDQQQPIESYRSAQIQSVDSKYISTATYRRKAILNSKLSYEIDSTKLELDGDLKINQENLLKLTEEILISILSSASNFPPQLNSLCVCLRQVLGKKYPNSDNTNLKAIGTVIFLRFINPAIVSPFEFGIVDVQAPAKILRGLMLVSKILQNIANNVEFSKEEHMLPFNDFVRQQLEPMKLWVKEISSEKKN